MKKYSEFGKIVLTFLVLSLFILSCEEKPIVLKIEYAETASPVTLKDKQVNNYKADYNKKIDRHSGLEIVGKLADLSAKKLNFREIETREKGMIVFRNEKDPSAVFEMDLRSGNFLYNGGLAEYKNDGNTPGLVRENIAEALALGYIEKLGLAPARKELKLFDIGGLSMAVLKEDNTTETYNKLVTVRFNRELAGVPVMGESRVVVHLGENGDLSGLIYYWAEIIGQKQNAPQELLADTEIVRALESKVRVAATDAEKIVIEKSDFVLYDDGRGVIEPAFHVQARLYYEQSDTGDGEKVRSYDVPYDYYVPVLKNPAAFYPYMDIAKTDPTDGRKLRIVSEDDE